MPNTATFTILHTNDRHGRYLPIAVSPGNATAQTGDPGRSPQQFDRAGRVGGFPILATLVEQFRTERGTENVVLLDGGDSFADDLLGNLTKGEAAIRLMNEVGYQAMALGNHDFDYGADRTRELQRIAGFPMRGANVAERASGEPFLGDPTLVADVGGVPVGILLLGYHHTDLTGNPRHVEALRFESGIEPPAATRERQWPCSQGSASACPWTLHSRAVVRLAPTSLQGGHIGDDRGPDPLCTGAECDKPDTYRSYGDRRWVGPDGGDAMDRGLQPSRRKTDPGPVCGRGPHRSRGRVQSCHPFGDAGGNSPLRRLQGGNQCPPGGVNGDRGRRGGTEGDGSDTPTGTRPDKADRR